MASATAETPRSSVASGLARSFNSSLMINSSPKRAALPSTTWPDPRSQSARKFRVQGLGQMETMTTPKKRGE
eukprot:4389186-Amphidinium_carterae.1